MTILITIVHVIVCVFLVVVVLLVFLLLLLVLLVLLNAPVSLRNLACNSTSVRSPLPRSSLAVKFNTLRSLLLAPMLVTPAAVVLRAISTLPLMAKF